MMRIFAKLGSIGLLAFMLAAPASGQDAQAASEASEGKADRNRSTVSPGAAAGPATGKYRFNLEFQPTEVEGMAEVRAKFKQDGVFQSILDDLADQVALPQDVPVTFKDCGEDNAFWDPEETSLSMCWELIALYNRGYEDEEGDEQAFLIGAERDTVLTGTTVFILLHELGHGMIDLFDIPTTGREEDSVDQFAALLLIASDEADMELEERPSRLALLGAYFFKAIATEPGELQREILSDEHGLGQQRYYDVMCLVLGSDMESYAPILTPGLFMVMETQEKNPLILDEEKATEWMERTDELNILPYARARYCEEEYQKYDANWAYLIDTFMSPPGEAGETGAAPAGD